MPGPNHAARLISEAARRVSATVRLPGEVNEWRAQNAQVMADMLDALQGHKKPADIAAEETEMSPESAGFTRLMGGLEKLNEYVPPRQQSEDPIAMAQARLSDEKQLGMDLLPDNVAVSLRTPNLVGEAMHDLKCSRRHLSNATDKRVNEIRPAYGTALDDLEQRTARYFSERDRS